MDKKNFLIEYFQTQSSLLLEQKNSIQDLLNIKDSIEETHNRGKKTMIFGNGGSAAIASHFSVDLTKNAKKRCTNYNESDLITCFSNDYGYEKWIEKAVEFYGDKDDNIILISSSGKSTNMVNAAKKARERKFAKIITFTGHEKNNPLMSLGDINIWVNSKSYNQVENIHQILLLALVDLIIGKTEYPPN